MHKIVDVNGFEVWARYDSTAEVYELFANYIGWADTLAEARQVGRDWVAQRVREGGRLGATDLNDPTLALEHSCHVQR
jgi:hypothetical protein